jgi:hypothetical protein
MNTTSFLKAVSQGLHTRWTSTLQEMRHSSPEVQHIFRANLQEIYSDTAKHYQENQDNLDSLSRSQLEHILSRPIDQHFAIITCK